MAGRREAPRDLIDIVNSKGFPGFILSMMFSKVLAELNWFRAMVSVLDNVEWSPYLSNYNIIQTRCGLPFAGRREIMLSGSCVG
jgi:hypothetical protein